MRLLTTGIVVLLLCSACGEPTTDSATPRADTAAPGPELAAAPDSVGTAPLLVIMRQLADDMNRINEGLWQANYDSIAAGAYDIAFHPKVPLRKRKALAEALGTDFQRFAQLDQRVHRLAQTLRRHARAQEMDSVMQTYGRLQDGCVSCHADFRDRIRGLNP